MAARVGWRLFLLFVITCIPFVCAAKGDDEESQKTKRLDALAEIAMNEQEDIKRRIKALLELIHANDPRGQIWTHFVYHKGVSASEVIDIMHLLKNYCHRDTKDDLLGVVTDERLILGIRVPAAQALAAWGDKRVLKPIMDMIKRSEVDRWFREKLIDALGDLREPSTEAFLLGIMTNPAYSGWEQVAAAEALVKLGNKMAIDFVFSIYDKSGGEDEVYPFDRLTRIITYIGGDRAIKALSQQIRRLPHEVVRVIAAMRQIGGPKVIPPLLQIAEDSYHELHVRIAATEALLEQLNFMSSAHKQRLIKVIREITAEVMSGWPQFVNHIENLRKFAQVRGLKID